MIDGVIQVDDDNIDDILDTTYEIVLMFCNFVVIASLYSFAVYVGVH